MTNVLQIPNSGSTSYRPYSLGFERSTLTLEQRIAEAREEARLLTERFGATSPQAAVAWDNVEELLVARAHRATKTAFEDYCQSYPDAPESRMYDV